MGRHRSPWEQTRRDMYLTQRFMGDISAFGRATLPKRLLRRSLTRTVWGRLMRDLFR